MYRRRILQDIATELSRLADELMLSRNNSHQLSRLCGFTLDTKYLVAIVVPVSS
jgi:hypothetical protein